MRKLHLLSSLATAATLLASHSSQAAIVVVSALTHSSNSGSGTPLNTGIALTAGQTLTVSSSTNDLWSAGALPRFSDANGLVGNRLATALDDSGQAVGTTIGANFGLPTIFGYSAPYGSLVGRIGSTYQLIGANFSGPAWGTGNLELFYWDDFTGDNAGQITFNITTGNTGAVPEPASWALMLAGFGMTGTALRKKAGKKPAFT
jgi:hypothetical protein